MRSLDSIWGEKQMLGMASQQFGVSVNLGGDGKGPGLKQWFGMEKQRQIASPG